VQSAGVLRSHRCVCERRTVVTLGGVSVLTSEFFVLGIVIARFTWHILNSWLGLGLAHCRHASGQVVNPDADAWPHTVGETSTHDTVAAYFLRLTLC